MNSNRPMPCINDPGDAIIKVTASCICGSDLHIYNGVFPGMCPGVLHDHALRATQLAAQSTPSYCDLIELHFMLSFAEASPPHQDGRKLKREP